MVSEEIVTLFLSEFHLQVEEIRKIYARLEGKAARAQGGEISEELVESIGYWLHNLYSAYEDLFSQVASFWENSLQDDGGYHLHLLKRMRMDIPGVRPPLLQSERAYGHLDELRGFRHVFRHAYSYGLDDERVLLLLRRVLGRKEEVLADIALFRDHIARLRFSRSSEPGESFA